MKKLLSFLVLFMSLFASSQDKNRGYDEKYFVGENLNLLKGKELILIPIPDYLQKFGYDYLYSDESLKKKFKSPNGYSNTPSDLANSKFLLEDYKKVNEILGDYVLKLRYVDGSHLYFLYNSKIASRFPFKTELPIVFPEDFYCSRIDVRKDKFSNKTIKYSPLLEPVSFAKDNGYFMTLTTTGNIPVVNGSGVIILLENGQKIIKKTKVDVEATSKGYSYSVFIPLTKTDISTLTKFNIDDFKLDVFENQLKLNGENYKQYLKCIIK